MTTTFPKPAPKPAPKPMPSPGGFTAEPQQPQRSTLTVSSGAMQGVGQKICIYGPGGVGKTSLAAAVVDVGLNPLFIDAEDSSKFLDVARVSPKSWDEVRQVLHTPDLMDDYDCVVVESLTKLEDWANQWVCQNIPHEKGNTIRGIEDYGYGKGYQHIYEAFLCLLGDLDAITRTGKHVFATAHVCTETVPNPEGENWLQYQPRLQSPPKIGKVRERVKEWCDHLLFVDFDKAVAKAKAIGHGTRTIYCAERPTYWAKSRSLADPVPYEKDSSEIWNQLFNKGE